MTPKTLVPLKGDLYTQTVAHTGNYSHIPVDSIYLVIYICICTCAHIYIYMFINYGLGVVCVCVSFGEFDWL